eukprot:scaffold16371_cov95-Isochrysis_galbana.AAC.6
MLFIGSLPARPAAQPTRTAPMGPRRSLPSAAPPAPDPPAPCQAPAGQAAMPALRHAVYWQRTRAPGSATDVAGSQIVWAWPHRPPATGVAAAPATVRPSSLAGARLAAEPRGDHHKFSGVKPGIGCAASAGERYSSRPLG